MLRAGAAGILRRTAATRPSWAPSVATTRWSAGARYQSTTTPPPPTSANAPSSAAAEATAPGPSSKDAPAASKPAEGKVSQAMLAKDAQTDAMLNKALLEALEDIQNEAAILDADTEAPLTVQGYDEPVLPDPVPASSKYDPTLLPLVPSPDSPFTKNPFHNPLTAPSSFSSNSTSSNNSLSEEEWHATLIRGRSISPAYHHTPLYHLPSASIHFRSYHQKLLDFFTHFALHSAASLGIPVSKVAKLPTQRSLWTVPRSPFAHKKSQENFERKTHKRVVKAWDAHPEVVQVWIGYLRKHALGGVGMRVTTWKREELGYGGKRVEEIQKRLAEGKGKKVPDAKIKGLAERIVKEELVSAAGKKDAAGVVKAP